MHKLLRLRKGYRIRIRLLIINIRESLYQKLHIYKIPIIYLLFRTLISHHTLKFQLLLIFSENKISTIIFCFPSITDPNGDQA